MEIILMSDSHGNSAAIEKVLKEYPNADYYYHLGDVCDDPMQFPDVTFLKGNNDFWYKLPDELTVNIAGHKIFMTHSHKVYGYGHGKQIELARLAKANGCDMLFYGHTHMYDDSSCKGVRLLNPGSLYYNRDYSDPGYMVIELDENDVKITRKTL